MNKMKKTNNYVALGIAFVVAIEAAMGYSKKNDEEKQNR